MPHTTDDLTNRCAENMMNLREWALADGQIDSATKAVVMAAIYSAVRCRDCVEGYLVIANEFGATRDQVREMMNLITMAQGCTGEVWAAKACTFYDDLLEGKINKGDEAFSWCLDLAGKVR